VRRPIVAVAGAGQRNTTDGGLRAAGFVGQTVYKMIDGLSDGHLVLKKKMKSCERELPRGLIRGYESGDPG
jgi:hypothetical protein